MSRTVKDIVKNTGFGTKLLPRKNFQSQAYETTSDGRRLGGWVAPELSPAYAATAELHTLRNRSQASIRNDQWMARAIHLDVANEIGTGIIPRADTPDKEFNAALDDLWKDYHTCCDTVPGSSVYTQQALASRSRKESGEVFIRIIRTRPNANSPVPLKFQVLEGSYCPLHLNKIASNGNEIKSGIEIDKNGTPVAAWLYNRDPLEGHMSINNLVRVPYTDLIHHFIRLRPGQLRGVPESAQALSKSYIFDKYNDAELARKESRANFTGTIERPDYGAEDYKFDPISGQPLNLDAAEVPMIELEAGSFPNLLPGEKLNLFEADDSGRGYQDYQKFQLMAISAGWNVPYQLLSGDYSEINDRIWRAIMNQYHREIAQVQDLHVIPQVCSKVWSEFVTRSVVSGVVRTPSLPRHQMLRAIHIPQAFAHIHPLQDVQAAALKVKEGFTSRKREVMSRSRGENVEEIDIERSNDKLRESELDLLDDDEIEQDTEE